MEQVDIDLTYPSSEKTLFGPTLTWTPELEIILSRIVDTNNT